MIWHRDRRRSSPESPAALFSAPGLPHFNWDPDSECWVAAFGASHDKIRVYVAPEELLEEPSTPSCQLLVEVLGRLDSLKDRAAEFLNESSGSLQTYRLGGGWKGPLVFAGVEIFEHEHEHEEGGYSLVFAPAEDPDAVWRVRMKVDEPVEVAIDD